MKSGKKQLRIGVLDMQGSVEEHVESLRRAGVTPVRVKTVADLANLDGLIMPGGESTTIGMLCEMYGLREAIVAAVRGGMPVYGTCAGAILLAKWGILDIDVDRNAYGSQIESFDTEITCSEISGGPVRAIFIRAPRFTRVGKKATVLAEHMGDPVLVRQDRILASSFHPELTGDDRVHEYFLSHL